MKVVCPHAGPIAPEVTDALAAAWRATASGGLGDWSAIDVSASDTAYTLLLRDLWAQGETFAIVEHDIVIRPDTLGELEGCPEPWCAFTYPFQGTHIAGLGCTKFSAELLAEFPNAVTVTWNEETAAHPAGHWCNLDDRLRRALETAGAVRHLHGPPVHHLHPMPTHGCG